MPFTHSLVASLFWAGVAFALFRWVVVRKTSVAAVVALAVFSHWLLDFVVHTPDLPLWSDASTKLGLGLWNHPIMSYVLESVFLLGGLWLYLGATSGSTKPHGNAKPSCRSIYGTTMNTEPMVG